MTTPVVIGEENKLHWIWLHVDGKVAEVGNRVDGGLEENRGRPRRLIGSLIGENIWIVCFGPASIKFGQS